MNARLLRIGACTGLASLGLILLPALDAPVVPVAEAAESVAALVDQAAQGAVGCASVEQSDLLLAQLGSCPLDLIALIISDGPFLPTSILGIGETATAPAPDGEAASAQADGNKAMDRAR